MYQVSLHRASWICLYANIIHNFQYIFIYNIFFLLSDTYFIAFELVLVHAWINSIVDYKISVPWEYVTVSWMNCVCGGIGLRTILSHCQAQEGVGFKCDFSARILSFFSEFYFFSRCVGWNTLELALKIEIWNIVEMTQVERKTCHDISAKHCCVRNQGTVKDGNWIWCRKQHIGGRQKAVILMESAPTMYNNRESVSHDWTTPNRSIWSFRCFLLIITKKHFIAFWIRHKIRW